MTPTFVWTTLFVFLLVHGGFAASTSHAAETIQAGLRAPAREFYPGRYRHDFEHVDAGGIRTSFSYTAHKVKHLIQLGDTRVGFVSAKCLRGDLTEITVTNLTEPLLWNTASYEANASIVVGNEDIKCEDGTGRIDALHEIVETPQLVSQSVLDGNNTFTFRLLAKTVHFSKASHSAARESPP